VELLHGGKHKEGQQRAEGLLQHWKDVKQSYHKTAGLKWRHFTKKGERTESLTFFSGL